MSTISVVSPPHEELTSPNAYFLDMSYSLVTEAPNVSLKTVHKSTPEGCFDIYYLVSQQKPAEVRLSPSPRVRLRPYLSLEY